MTPRWSANWHSVAEHWSKWSRPIAITFLKILCKSSAIFWDVTPCSPLSINRRFGGTCRLYLQGQKISWARNQRESSSFYFFDLEDAGNMFLRNVCDTQRTTRRYIPEDSTLHNHRCENLKPCMYVRLLHSKSAVLERDFPVTFY
jgi:hypothetical protein